MEHRRGHRVCVDANVSIDMRRRRYGAGQVIDISHSGVLVRTRMTLPLYARAHLRFVTHEGNAAHLRRLDGQVVRLDQDVVAFEWDHPESPDIAALLTHSAQPVNPASPLVDGPRAAGPHR